ncbi:DNA primase [Candidatus Falkowbacteria bacterium CG11_big_fil_rev_8_21_14_0_20_39_10]|uniref:DNA primase n=1 Tax=Candidatus Falkowbacteria bacterium CG11_big_fil_rev_8_21_14_0_20_39_10 TaxID=1974570 RepID=A0A2M6K7T3_9BACT|nr:MAG: DNA primase [Candidatus Falkowbacteria bacterium CG11_big_fil_rev_8_21_14_0_20_39_10]
MQPSDEIKSRLDIVDLIRDYIQLKPAGVNFRALCPFHREKTPSFMVSPERQIWHCFGCGKGGDHFSFVMEMEGLTFVEALRLLAPKAGVAIKRSDPKLASQRNRLLDIMEASASYYYKNLTQNQAAGNIRKYLEKRGVKDETIDDWQIGYAPESWDDLIIFLKSKGFLDNEIFLAGMSIKKEGASRFYNRFRDRIMFPIRNVNGQVVAFSARVNPEKEETEKMGKYINSPQTMIYDKSGILFGLDKAKMAIKNEGLVVVVEGQMDAITAHRQGFKNVVASSGTALTVEQLTLIKRYTNKIALAFDMDTAGQRAAERGIREAMRAEMDVRVVKIAPGEDPDSYIKNNPTGWAKAVKEAKSIMEYYFEIVFSGLDQDKIENRREAARKLLPIIAKIGNKIEQGHWLKQLGQKIDTSEEILRETMQAAAEKEKSYQKESAPEAPVRPPQDRQEMISESFLALLLKFPGLIEYAVNQINVDLLPGLDNEAIYKNLIIYYNSTIESWTQKPEGEGQPPIEYSGFKSWLEKNISPQENLNRHPDDHGHSYFNLLDKLVLLGERDYYNFGNEEARSELAKIIAVLKRNYFRGRMREITKLISDSEQAGDRQKAQELMEELKLLSDEERNA